MNNYGLMNVEIDGKTVQRPIDRIEHGVYTFPGGSREAGPAKYVPVLRAGEQILWRIGSDIPVIIQT